MKNDLRTRVFLRTERRTYYYVLKTAALALLSAAAAILPFVISGHGVLTLRDDFNYQQLAFSILCGDFIKHGNFGWSWVTDLGSSVIGSYSFYNLASPFALLTAWLPAAAIPYAAAPVLILKYCTAAVLAFLFIKRFVGNPDAAVFGALLYAFCGFQTVNLIFPFHDVTALFPLLLIGLEELVINRRRGVFALSVALSCMLNYYFFFGQIVFLVIYFAFRFIIGETSSLHPAACETKKPETLSRKIIRRLVNAAHCIAEGLLGIGIAGVIFIPSVLSVLQNPRIGSSVSEIIFDWTRYFTILQGYFLPADVMGSQGYFLEKACTSCSLCLPFIAMSFVFAYMLKNKKKPLTLFAVSIIIISCIPILNSMFSMFNSQYYARWFYMAALIFALISSIALSEAAAAEICRAESSDRKKDLFHKKYLIRGSAANLICVVITIFAEAALILIFKITGHPYLEKINIGTAYAVSSADTACTTFRQNNTKPE